MLIHISRFISVQVNLLEKVQDYIEEINEKIQIPGSNVYKDLENIFIEDFECLETVTESWKGVKEKIHQFTENSTVSLPRAYVINSEKKNSIYRRFSRQKNYRNRWI